MKNLKFYIQKNNRKNESKFNIWFNNIAINSEIIKEIIQLYKLFPIKIRKIVFIISSVF